MFVHVPVAGLQRWMGKATPHAGDGMRWCAGEVERGPNPTGPPGKMYPRFLGTYAARLPACRQECNAGLEVITS